MSPKHQVLSERPNVLVLSHVVPVRRASGQEQRVYYMLDGLRKRFNVSFATAADADQREAIRKSLGCVTDELIFLEPRLGGIWQKTASLALQVCTGLKRSHYQIGRVQFSPSNVRTAVGNRRFDCVVLEYWHAAATIGIFRDAGIPCVLDQHNVLWRSYKEQLQSMRGIPELWKRWALSQYRRREEHAWKLFDGVISINRAELEETLGVVSRSTKTFCVPMGTDLRRWQYVWNPAAPHRVAYYGGLGSSHNAKAALQCYQRIMPSIWERFPETELWLVGSNPPEEIRALQSADYRVHVTGFVPEPEIILGAATVVLCPWTGTYGFRSRLIEVMATGVPLVASEEAVYGMGLKNGDGVLLGSTDEQMIRHTLMLLEDRPEARRLSLRARDIVESQFSLAATYSRFADDLESWLQARSAAPLSDRATSRST